jgi:hypothetical protein
MLTTLDDYPIHQTSNPVNQPASGDPNHYDRYFFNGYTRDGSLFFAAALGLYPNRKVMDAAFSVVRDGRQYSLIASRRAPLDPSETEVGPIRVQIEEPLRRLRLKVAPNEQGLEADLVFEARTVAVQEPHFQIHDGVRLVMDVTRLTQWGSWSGSVKVDGQQVALDPKEVLGCRDRSWGVRRVGERDGGAPGGTFQFFWLWAPLNFDDVCVHFDVNEDGEGRQWHSNGVVIPILKSASDSVIDPGGATTSMASVEHHIQWETGARRSTRAQLLLNPKTEQPIKVDLEPMLTFQMIGIGYGHPEWGHGMWKGESAVFGDSWKLSDINPLDPRNLHIQQLCRAKMAGKEGVGVLEQLVIGPHAPSGFKEMLDGAK